MFDRSKFVDSTGRYYTQSLFIEVSNDATASIYTLKDYDYEYKGVVYPSLKRLYIDLGDPVEFEFASTYLAGWRHWQRICENKILRKHVDEWRDELEIKLRSQAFKEAYKLAKTGTFQAAKWVADRGWAIKGAGRPTKADVEHRKTIEARIASEYDEDVVRMFQQKQG